APPQPRPRQQRLERRQDREAQVAGEVGGTDAAGELGEAGAARPTPRGRRGRPAGGAPAGDGIVRETLRSSHAAMIEQTFAAGKTCAGTRAGRAPPREGRRSVPRGPPGPAGQGNKPRAAMASATRSTATT